MDRQIMLFLPLLPTFFAIIALYIRFRKKKNVLWIIEMVALTCAAICMAVFLLFVPENRSLVLLAIAFVFSIGGDIYMKRLHSDRELVLGISGFFIAHLFILLYLVFNEGFSLFLFFIIFVPFLIYYFNAFHGRPRMRENKKLSYAALCYLTVSCATLATAMYSVSGTLSSHLFLLAIFCLVMSDFLIAYRETYDYQWTNYAIMPLYYACHILIAWSVVLYYTI